MSKRPQAITDLPDAARETPEGDTVPQKLSPGGDGVRSPRFSAEARGGSAGKGLLRPLLLGGSVLGLFLLVALLRSAAGPLIAVLGQARWLSWVDTIPAILGGIEVFLIGLFLALVGYFVFKEFSAYLRLTSVQALRKAAVEQSSPMQRDAREELRERLDSYIAELRARRPAAYSQQAGVVQKRMSEILDPEEWADTLNSFLLREMDEEARRVIVQEAVGVGLTTALSPRGLVDVSIVLWRNARMINRIASIYVGRPGRYGTWMLLRRCLASVALAGTAEGLTDLLPATLPLKGLGAMGQCVVNAIMTCRVGLRAQRECRPLPLDASEKPIQDLTKHVVRRIWDRVKGEDSESA